MINDDKWIADSCFSAVQVPNCHGFFFTYIISTTPSKKQQISRIKPFDAHCCLICNFCHPGTLTLRAERQSPRMSTNTNDRLTWSGTGCFIAITLWHQWGQRVKNHHKFTGTCFYVKCCPCCVRTQNMAWSSSGRLSRCVSHQWTLEMLLRISNLRHVTEYVSTGSNG